MQLDLFFQQPPIGSQGCLPRVGEVARSARGADRKRAPLSPLGETSVRSTAKRQKSAKGVWVGETNEVCLRNVRVFPHKLVIVLPSPVLRNSSVDCFGSIRRRLFRRSRGRALTLPYFYSSICLPKYIAAAWTSALCSFVANSLSSPESMITAPLTSPCESIGAAAIA